MKRLIKILSVVIVLCVAVVVAGVAVLSSLDFNEYKDVIAGEAKKATGRDLKIAGDLKLDISLTPSLYVDGVTFANAPWGSRPAMLTLKRLEAEVALLPLLSSQVDVKRLILVGMDLLLETDKKGTGNWQIGGPPEAGQAGKGGGSLLPIVRDVRMKNLNVTYRDGQTGEETKVQLAALDVAADGPSAPLKVALNGAINGNPISADGTIASVQQLTAGGELPLDLRFAALGVKATAKGAIADPKNLTGIAVTATAAGDSLAAALDEAKKLVPALSKVSVPDLGPFNVAVTVSGSPRQLSLTNLNARLGRAGEMELAAKGSIADALKPAGLNLDVSARVKDPAALAKAFGAAVPPLPALEAQALVKDAAGGYGLSGINVKLGRSDLQGSATARLGGARPSVTADLTSALLDLDELLPKQDGAQPAAAPADGRLFPADPLPLDGLKAADANIKLKAAKVRVQGLDVTEVDLGLALAGGRLMLRPVAATVSDGKVSGEVSLGADQAVPPVKVDLTVSKLDYGKLQAAMGGKPVATGLGDLRVAVAGAGNSVREIMAGLDGNLRLVTENGRVESAFLNVASADITSALPMVDSKGDKDLRCAVADLQVVKGIANSKAIVAETGGLSVIGVGAVNLRDETLNLVFEPRAKKTSLLSAALVPVAIRGTLAKPEPKVNPADLVTGVAGNVLSGAAAFATMGLSALAQSAFNRATSTDGTDYCQQALAGKAVTPAKGQQAPSSSGGNQPVPAQQQQKPAESLDKTLDNLGKGIGGGLKGLFGK